jgi:hypothetical protein
MIIIIIRLIMSTESENHMSSLYMINTSDVYLVMTAIIKIDLLLLFPVSNRVRRDARLGVKVRVSGETAGSQDGIEVQETHGIQSCREHTDIM